MPFSIRARGLALAIALALPAPLAAQTEETPLAATAQDYEPRPAMWRLSDEDTTIYLFGTFHILPEGFRWRTPAFDRAVEESAALVVETSDGDLEASGPQVQGHLVERLAARSTTSEQLTPANRDKWRKVAQEADLPFAFFDRMPIVFAMLSAGLSTAEMAGSTHDLGVETILEGEFAAKKKPVLSIEDGADILRSLLDIEEAPLIAELDQDLTKWDGVSIESFMEIEGDDALASEHDWARGKLTPVFTAEDLASPGSRALYDVLMTRRNVAWAAWLQQRLAMPGTTFVAVGAGHFEGDDSVLAKLADRGLQAERIQ